MTAAEAREKSRATEALARRLRERDAAVKAEAADVPDAEPFAAEFIAALWGQGWRPALAPDWRRPAHGRPPTGEFRAALKQLHAKADGRMVQGEVIPDHDAVEAPQPKGGAP
jgi:hypothetical protein